MRVWGVRRSHVSWKRNAWTSRPEMNWDVNRLSSMCELEKMLCEEKMALKMLFRILESFVSVKTFVIVLRYSSVSVLSRWVPETQVGGFFSASFRSFKTRLTQRLASVERSQTSVSIFVNTLINTVANTFVNTQRWICLSGMFCTRPNLSPLCDICKNIFNFISGNKSFPFSWTRDSEKSKSFLRAGIDYCRCKRRKVHWPTFFSSQAGTLSM